MRIEDIPFLTPGTKVVKVRLHLVIIALTKDPETGQFYAVAAQEPNQRVEITRRGFACGGPHEVICDEAGSRKFSVGVFCDRKRPLRGCIIRRTNAHEWERES